MSYILTNTTQTTEFGTFTQIEAYETFRLANGQRITKGTKGGFIQHVDQLDQDSWIEDTIYLLGTTRVVGSHLRNCSRPEGIYYVADSVFSTKFEGTTIYKDLYQNQVIDRPVLFSYLNPITEEEQPIKVAISQTFEEEPIVEVNNLKTTTGEPIKPREELTAFGKYIKSIGGLFQ